jgi:5-methyltetrahydropteroyltriglutamate--homocysteine methyltransferase
MFTSRERILTTHTGSLPRSAELTELYARRAAGETIDEARLEALGKVATRHVVRRQLASGIDIGNNGEQQREAFFLYVRRRMSGFGGSWTRRPMADTVKYPGYLAWQADQEGSKKVVSNRGTLPAANAAVRYLDPALVQAECDEFHAALREVGGKGFAEAFMTAPSPGIIATAMRNQHYDTEDAYLAALGEAMRVEYEAIHKAGFLLQIDAPDLAMERHCAFQDKPLTEFVDFCEKVIDTINAALVNVPRDRVRLHACWGNYEGPHDCDVDLQDVLPPIARAKVGGWVLPFANPRHAHEYRCLSKLPLDDGQVVIAGVIDPLTNFVEHPEVVADRIERAVQVVGDASRVQGGTDCGFDTSAGRGRVAEDVVWAKLKAMSDGAAIASKRLGMSG